MVDFVLIVSVLVFFAAVGYVFVSMGTMQQSFMKNPFAAASSNPFSVGMYVAFALAAISGLVMSMRIYAMGFRGLVNGIKEITGKN